MNSNLLLFFGTNMVDTIVPSAATLPERKKTGRNSSSWIRVSALQLPLLINGSPSTLEPIRLSFLP